MPEYQQFMDASVQQADQELNLSILGIYWVMGSLGPFLVYLGFWMIKKADKTKRVEFFPPATRTRNLCLILIPSILAIAVGILCFCLGLFAALQIQSRFRQLEEEKRATNRVDMRFVALYSILEMLYGNPSLNNFF